MESPQSSSGTGSFNIQARPYGLLDIVNPCSDAQKGARAAFDGLELNQKIKVVFLTIVAALVGCGLFSVFTGQIVFYHAVTHFEKKNREAVALEIHLQDHPPKEVVQYMLPYMTRFATNLHNKVEVQKEICRSQRFLEMKFNEFVNGETAHLFYSIFQVFSIVKFQIEDITLEQVNNTRNSMIEKCDNDEKKFQAQMELIEKHYLPIWMNNIMKVYQILKGTHQDVEKIYLLFDMRKTYWPAQVPRQKNADMSQRSENLS